MNSGFLPALVHRPACTAEDTTAVLSVDGELGYRDLWGQAEAVASLLGDELAGERVGLLFARSAEYVASLLGVLLAGAVAVPLDVEVPDDRLRRIVRLAAPRTVLCAGAPPGLLRDDAIRWTDVRAAIDAAPPAGGGPGVPRPGDPAIALFTSGSTGQPKGVLLGGLGLCNRLTWGQETYRLDPSDRVLHKASPGFDASLHEIFAPLIAGATMVIAPPGLQYDSRALVGLMQETGITTAHFVPSMLRHVLDEPDLELCTDLRRVFCGGEALDMELVRRLRSTLGCALFNQYGPTETTLSVTYWDCSEPFDGRIAPIGRPISGVTLRIADESGAPVAAGEPGELWIGGVAVGLGYLGEEEGPRAGFLPDPSGPDGARVYRTGDLVVETGDGLLEYRGRIDDQVKIRGVRVEPAEVTAALRRHPQVRDAVVVPFTDSSGSAQLAAYVVAPDPPDPREIRRFLAGRLPTAMIPARVAFVEDFPRLPNGKISRADLPPLAETPEPSADAGQSGLKGRLRELWRESLSVDRVEDEDDFVSLGGHSLVALRICARLRETADIDVDPRSCLEAANFGEWTESVAHAER